MRHRRGKHVALLALTLLLIFSIATAVEIPDPKGYFNDFAGVVPTESARQIESSLRSLRENYGFEFAIVTIAETGDLTAKQYAVELFEQWGIGGQERDSGLLLLNVTGGESGEREIWFEVGYGLEGAFTDTRTGIILDEALPQLREDDYAGAYQTIIAAVDDVAVNSNPEEWSGDSQTPAPEPSGQRQIPGIVGIVVVLYLVLLLGARYTGQWWLYNLLFNLLFIFFRGGRGGGGGFGGFGGGSSGGGGSGRRY